MLNVKAGLWRCGVHRAVADLPLALVVQEALLGEGVQIGGGIGAVAAQLMDQHGGQGLVLGFQFVDFMV